MTDLSVLAYSCQTRQPGELESNPKETLTELANLRMHQSHSTRQAHADHHLICHTKHWPTFHRASTTQPFRQKVSKASPCRCGQREPCMHASEANNRQRRRMTSKRACDILVRQANLQMVQTHIRVLIPSQGPLRIGPGRALSACLPHKASNYGAVQVSCNWTYA